MEYKDGKVVILPTNNEANMGDFIIYQYNQDCYIDGKNLKDNLVCGIKKCDGNIDTTNQHLYITSDEEIKRNDWFYHGNHGVNLCRKVEEGLVISTTAGVCNKSACKK